MSSLAELHARLSVLLMDTGYANWAVTLLDECLNIALDEYSEVSELEADTVITLPGDGREIALDDLDGLINVMDVYWPFDSAAAAVEVWPPNRVRGFRVVWDEAQPILFLDIYDPSSNQPQEDDEMRIWYTKAHTLAGLQNGTVTTIPFRDESLLLIGAAGHAALSRLADLLDTAGTDMFAMALLGTWGNSRLRDFRSKIQSLRGRQARSGPAYSKTGWTLDKWDT